MSPTPNSTLDDLQQTIADLKRQLAESNAERDEARRRLAESTTERDEALERQTATAEVLQVINSSPGDLTPVFDAMLEKATTLCDAAFGIMLTWDGQCFHRVAFRGASAELIAALRQPTRPVPGSMAEQILNGAEMICAADIREEPAYRIPGAPVGALVDIGGARSYVAIALRRDDGLLGVFSIYRQEVRPFSDKQIVLLQNFAAQAVIAMENARLITETSEALEQQTATAEVLQVINSSPGDLTPVFDAILEKAHALCGAANGSLQIYDGESIRAVATRGLPDRFANPLREPHRLSLRNSRIRAAFLQGVPYFQISDLSDTVLTEGYPTLAAAHEITGTRTLLNVPLRKDGELLGVIVAGRREVRLFTDKQIALLQNFAAQAVIAIENARLITETREALEQQTATAEVLQVINSSPGDLAPVFDAMLERAVRLCEFDFASLWTYDGTSFCPVAKHRVPEPLWEYVQEHTPPAFARLVGGDRLVHIADVQGATDQTDFSRNVRRLGLDTVRSILIVPLRKDETLLGLIAAYRCEVGPFSGKQIALLQNFAAQAVIAMENARLITETREALEQQTATAEVLQVINSSPGDLTPVFDAILEKAHTLCDAATGSLRVIDGDMIRAVAFRGQSGEFADRVQQGYPFASAPLLASLRDGAPFVHISDVAERDDSISRLSTASGNRTILAVPLRKDDALLGMIVAGRKEVRPFTHKEIALLQNFAAQAVIAMENARLITETREALEQQTATAEVLQVINSSPGDLVPVFDAILDRAHSLCGAYLGSLFTYDGERFWPVAGQRPPAQFSELMREGFRPGPGNPFSRVLEGEPLVHIADIRPLAAQHPDDAGLHVAVEVGLRTFMVVPLRKDNVLLGVITANRREVRPFTDKQIALLQNFAAQAVIAMENARLITETREALEQQTATAEVLGVINSSPGDLAPVFDTMLEKAVRLCDAAFGILWTYDGELFHAAWLRDVTPAFAEFLREPTKPVPGGTFSRLLAGEPIAEAVDIAGRESYRAGTSRLRRAFLDLGGAQTALFVALRKDQALLGAFTIYRKEIRPFTDKQTALVTSFAAQAVIAMENARLITETREALEQQTATAEVLRVINSSPGDLTPVFDAMLEKATRLCEAKYGILATYDGDKFREVAAVGLPVESADALSRLGHPPPETVLGRLERTKQTVQMADISSEPSAAVFAVNPWLRQVRTSLSVPMLKEGELVGAFSIFREEVQPFSDKQIALLQNFAAQAVIAMENARLITETREALEQQTATAEVLQVINSSPGDLGPVFDSILEKAHRLCGITFGSLQLSENGAFRAVAVRGVADSLAELLREPVQPMPGTPAARLADGEAFVQVEDVAEAAKVHPEHRRANASAAHGLHTVLFVPLRKDTNLLGFITGYREEVRLFSEKEIALLQNFAAQAVIAMENARLLGELRQRTDEVGELNRGLEARVAEQVDELGRVGRLKRFLAPQLAELIVSQGDEKILESHRREIVVVFCDLRGYTAFTETAEPEEVLDFLRQYHGALGPLVSQFEGTLDQFSGDGIMVFFNDPIPCPDPAERAVKMAVAMREVARTLIAAWRRRGRMLGFGAGIAQGYATLGQIGFADRSGYTAIGTVCNLAARLCAEAKDGQILIAQLVAVAVEETTPLEEVGELTLKGLTQPVVAYNVLLQAVQPALRVIEGGGPQSV